MEISWLRSKSLLYVLFDDDELVERNLEGGLFRRRYGRSQGLTLTFERSGKGFFLYISFDRCKDPEVLSQVANGQSGEELQVLWELAHLPCAKMFGSNVMLPDGRSVELIDTVKFELRKVMDGLWAAGGSESEVHRRDRQMRLNGLSDGLPRIFSEKAPGLFVTSQAESPRGEVIFTNKRTGTDPERRFEPEKPPFDLPTEAEPQVDAPSDPEKRDPNAFAECDGCKDLFYEGDLSEIRPGTWVCQFCRTSYPVAMALGLNPDELPSLGNKKCDGCGELLTKDELTEVEPGRWLCHLCILS